MDRAGVAGGGGGLGARRPARRAGPPPPPPRIGPGSRRRKEFAPPANIDDFLTSLRHYVARDELTAVITLPDRSWMIRGHRLTELPIGVLDELNGHRRLTRRGKETIRVSKRIPWAINGNATVELKVRDPQ